jgi:serine/threonine kinase 32
LKPENLLIDEGGHIHLTDFNVAIMLKEKIPSSKSGTTAYMGNFLLIYSTGNVFGKALYLFSRLVGTRYCFI